MSETKAPQVPLEKQVADAHRLRLFMEDEAIVDAFALMELAAVKAWKAGETVEAREAAHQRVRALEELKTQIKVLIDRGTWATDTLERQQRKAEQDRAQKKLS